MMVKKYNVIHYNLDAITTVLKECKEEIGISLEKDEVEIFNYSSRNCIHINSYYLKKDIDLEDIILQEEEVESVSWLSK